MSILLSISNAGPRVGAWNKSAGITDYELRHILPVENHRHLCLGRVRGQSPLHLSALVPAIAQVYRECWGRDSIPGPSEQFSLGSRYWQLELHRMQTESATHLVF